MQHDIVELLDAIKYAKENFGDDVNTKYYFTRKDLVDAFDKPYREDKVKFECVTVLVFVTGTKIEINVVGLGDDIELQREFIAEAIETHRKERA